jgi:hypothetical protein
VRPAVVALGEGQPLLHDVADLVPGGDQLEDAPVNLPVTELSGPDRVMAEIHDMQPVGQVIEHDARLAAEHPYWPGLVQRLDVRAVDALAPVPGGWLEPQVFRRRARGEKYDIGLIRSDPRLVWCPLETGQDPVSHRQFPSAGLNHTCPS